LLKRPAKIAAKNIETPMAAISDNTKITRLMSDIEHLAQEKLQTEYDTLSKDNDALQTKYDTLSKDNDALQTKYDTLSKNNDALQTKYDTLSKNNDALQTKYDALSDYVALQTNYDALSDYVASSNLLPIKITAIKVGNWNNGWVNRPGKTLTHTSVYRLNPKISYQALANANIKLDIKWFFPNNDLQRWEESAPTGYTYTENITVSAQGKTYTLRAWGWDEPGRFPSGIHRIEIWWNGIMLSSTTVTLN
jgi:chaperonin cofactor prefoldin